MISLADIEQFMQEENIIPDFFSEDSFRGHAALVYETDNMMVALRPVEDNIVLTFNDFNEEEYLDVIVTNEDNFDDLGYGLASIIYWIAEGKTGVLKVELQKVLEKLNEENFEEDERYSPDFL